MKGAGGAGNSGSRGTRRARPGPGVGASYCDGLARVALSSRQLYRRMLLPCVLRADVVDGVPRYCEASLINRKIPRAVHLIFVPKLQW